MSNSKINFSQPNPYTLSQIDSFFQNHSILERRWERYGDYQNHYNGPGDGYGWDGIQKERPTSFLKAWHAAISFMHQNEITEEEIKEWS